MLVGIVTTALPCNHEITGIIHGDRWNGLVLKTDRVDLKFGSLRDSGGIVALPIATPTVAVLVLALPYHHEVSCRIHRDGRRVLVIRGRGVDAELAALRNSRCVIALGVDAEPTTVLVFALPYDDEVSCRI